jgi:hypothetical protein
MRRRLGPVAWCTLEAIADHTAPPSDDSVCAEVSVRTIAAELGIAPNTANRALRRLVHAGLVEPRQSRAGHGRFGAGSYRVTITSDVLRVTFPIGKYPAPSLPQPKPLHPRQLARVTEQLALLPSS